MRQASDPEKATQGRKMSTPGRSSQRRKRIVSILLCVFILISAILLFDATVIYLVLEIAKQFIFLIWWAISAVGFYLFKIYSQFVSPDQWRS